MLHLAIPVSAADLHLLDGNIAVLRHLGSLERHRAVFIPTKEVSGSIADAVDGLSTVMNDVRVSPLNTTPTGGWPKACNQHFTHLVQIMSSCGTPWLLWELDMTARLTGWLDALETEYNLIGKPFMGMNVPTRYKEGSPHHYGEDHMVGAGIYPQGFGLAGRPYGVLWKFCAHQEDAYDIYQSGEIRPFLHNTSLMQHMWGTVNFRKTEDGTIICDPKEGNPEGSDHSGAVRAKAAVVHGCKDGSLARLVLSEQAERAEFMKEKPQFSVGGPLEQAAQSIYAPKVVPGDTNYKMDHEPKAEEVEDGGMDFDAMGNSGTELGMGDPEIPEAPEEAPSEPVGEEMSTKDKVLAMIEGKNLKVKDVATAMGVPDQKDFETWLLQEGFTFAGVAKWLKAPSESVPELTPSV